MTFEAEVVSIQKTDFGNYARLRRRFSVLRVDDADKLRQLTTPPLYNEIDVPAYGLVLGDLVTVSITPVKAKVVTVTDKATISSATIADDLWWYGGELKIKKDPSEEG